MNPLDELLSTTGEVDDITSAGLRRARAALDSAIVGAHSAQSSTNQAQAPHRQGRPQRGSKRGVLIAACAAAAAAVVAGTTVSVLSTHSGDSQASPSTPAGTKTAAGTNATAAVLLRAAGKAAGAQKGGWPNAAYWHVASVYERNGKTYHRDIWLSHNDSGVLEDNGVGPGLISLSSPTRFEGLTWAQLYALPTDPAQLQSVLESKFTNGFSPDANPTPSPGAVSQSQELFVVVGDLLRESPASPALREALYEVAANIPGVAVKGDYTDALGRTGTAVERNGEDLVIDPGNGQLLADIYGAPDVPSSCGTSNVAVPVNTAGACVGGGVGYTYVSQGPASNAP